MPLALLRPDKELMVTSRILVAPCVVSHQARKLRTVSVTVSDWLRQLCRLRFEA